MRHYRAFSVLLISVFLAASLVQAQTTSAILNGLVQDSSGAVIVGAAVKVINDETNIVASTISNIAGVYSFPVLQPGHYHVQVSAAGFRTMIKLGVTLNVQEARALNFTLQVGAPMETVTVTGELPLVNADSATAGTLIAERELMAIPLTNRNYTQMLQMSAGVTASLMNAAQTGRNSQDVYVNGGTTQDNNFQMDGASVNNGMDARAENTLGAGGIPIPNPDAILEFNIQTGQYDASYGGGVGANVNVVTKSGNNRLHGNLFEYFRNEVLNANDFFLNRSGQARPPMRQNQFGGTLGGPIKRDKVFFFGSYQGTRQVNGLGSYSAASFNEPPLTNDRSAAALGALFAGQQSVYQPSINASLGLPAGTGVAILPNGSNINPVALALLQYKLPNGQYYIPTPQTIVNGLGISTFSVPSHYSEDQMIANIDYAISQKHLFSARWFSSWDNQRLGFADQPIAGVNIVPGNGPYGKFHNYSLTPKLTSTLSNRIVNELRFSYIRTSGDTLSGAPLTAKDVGMTPGVLSTDIPSTIIPGMFAVGANVNDGFLTANQSFQFADQLSWNEGKHNFRAGGQFVRSSVYTNADGIMRGAVVIASFPDFLLGMAGCTPASYPATCNPTNPGGTSGMPYSNLITSYGFSGTIPRLWHANNWSLFLQDDYKLHPRLTLNLGVRWDVYGNFSESDGVMSDFNPAIAVGMPPAQGTYSGFVVPANFQGSVPAGVQRNDNDTVGDARSMKNIGPRIGLSWRPIASSENLVVHAGYGIFYTAPVSTGIYATGKSEPFYLQQQLSGAQNALATFQVPFNPTLPPQSSFPIWQPRTPTSVLSEYAVSPVFRSPMTQQWSLNLQFELKGGVMLEPGYVGSRSEHLYELTQWNEAQLASPQNPINGVTTNTVSNVGLRVPLVGIAPSGLRAQQYDGASSYNALEMTVRKRMSRALQFLATYTYSKTLSNLVFAPNVPTIAILGGMAQSTAAGDSGKGQAEYSRPQRLVLSYMYSFPNVNQGKGALGKLLASWDLSGVTTFQSGNPLTLTDARAGSIYGSSAGVFYMPANLCPGVGYSSLATSGSLESRLNGYINKNRGLRASCDRQRLRLRQYWSWGAARARPEQLGHITGQDFSYQCTYGSH